MELEEFLVVNPELKDSLKNKRINCKIIGDEVFFQSPHFTAKSAIEKEIADVVAEGYGVEVRGVVCSDGIYYFQKRINIGAVSESIMCGILAALDMAFQEYKQAVRGIARFLLIVSIPEIQNQILMTIGSPRNGNMANGGAMNPSVVTAITVKRISADEFLCLILPQAMSF